MSKYSQDVINMLYQHHNTYISGQHIANQLNISRAAVKKIIDQLKVEGCDIISINHKGHQLKSLPDQWYLGIIKPIVNKHQIFDQIEVYRTADSTQIIAKQMLVNNSKSYLILSDEQTKGRGRFNRNWSSSKGKGLWMSVVLRPNVPFDMMPKFNLFIALGIRDAIQAFANDEVKIKWPND
ncbi:MAG: biotin--[acetyl-CoA-carboxylase] ligase, partial [Staphylococcus lugdunensis]|nr:biotin--[acetyl-CoA-carboxylase] ligase [Staphylococcus lugdunensis]